MNVHNHLFSNIGVNYTGAESRIFLRRHFSSDAARAIRLVSRAHAPHACAPRRRRGPGIFHIQILNSLVLNCNYIHMYNHDTAVYQDPTGQYDCGVRRHSRIHGRMSPSCYGLCAFLIQISFLFPYSFSL